MKIKILQEKLNECLSNIERITGKDSTLPILGNILIKTEKNFLNLLATNLETGVAWRILSKTERDGSIALPAQAFAGFINSLPNKSIDISVEGALMTVVCDGRKSIFKGVVADEFPVLPINTEGDLLEVGAHDLCDALAQVVGFTSLSTVKPEIAGVYLAISNGVVKIVATDSFRLGEKTLSLGVKAGAGISHLLILPQRAVREIIALFGSSKGNLKIYFSPNQITIEMMMEEMEQPKIQFVTRLIEGEFPDYQAIIPSKSSLRLVFSKKEFINHIKSASLFASKTNEIGFGVSQKSTSVRIYSQSSDLGEYEGDMRVLEAEGEDIAVSFNYKFLLDGLNVLNGDKCVLELSGDDGPGVLKSADKPDFIYIVMPIKKN